MGDHLPNITVTSNKGAIGHLLGAAGAVEAAMTVLTIANGIVPSTANCSDSDVHGGVAQRIVTGDAREQTVRVALSNSFGFGGTNASLLFTSPQND